MNNQNTQDINIKSPLNQSQGLLIKRELSFSQMNSEADQKNTSNQQSRKVLLQNSIFDSLQKIFVDSDCKTVTKKLAFNSPFTNSGNGSPEIGSLSKIIIVKQKSVKKVIKKRKKRRVKRVRKCVKAVMLR